MRRLWTRKLSWSIESGHCCFQRQNRVKDSSFCIMQRCILALALGASAFENSYLNNIAKRAVQANTATMDNARVAKDSASYLESLPQTSSPTIEATVAAPSYLESLPQTSSPTIEATVAAPSYLESLPSLEAAVAAPAAVKPTTPTPAELAAAAAPVKLASGAEAEFAAQCVAVHKANFRGAFTTD